MINTLKQNIIYTFIRWHFLTFPSHLVEIWSNFLRFTIEFFSVPTLLKTWIEPWRRLSENYKGGVSNIAENIQVLILNIFSRVLGFLIRTVVIALGVISIFLVLAFGVLVIAIWIILPIFIITGIIFSSFILI